MREHLGIVVLLLTVVAAFVLLITGAGAVAAAPLAVGLAVAARMLLPD